MDRGQPSRNISLSLIVNVSDINDCTPIFDVPMSSLFTRLNEELPNGQYKLNSASYIVILTFVTAGTSIMSFTATDCDSGNNGLIQYSITRGNQLRHFAINNITGLLTSNVILDREEASQYILVITAADLGDPSHSSSVEVTAPLCSCT